MILLAWPGLAWPGMPLLDVVNKITTTSTKYGREMEERLASVVIVQKV